MKNTIEQLEVMANLNLENTVGGYSAGACFTDIVLVAIDGIASGAAGGALSAGVGCFIAGAQEISDGLFK
ncbi:hypothetical protein [Streptococcus thoraltensis]|uniref:hypothetical protein n=1 Tax=Streptococcus thoraltensis TaxID=55085 RepID=UPI0003717DAA|nr:hypothetical protein [Streptococcus thoraltensis]MDY4762230.1 TmhB bacteriocin enhancer peptide [Streptococcus thoraltensis]